jgi:hypothetical protein
MQLERNALLLLLLLQAWPQLHLQPHCSSENHDLHAVTEGLCDDVDDLERMDVAEADELDSAGWLVPYLDQCSEMTPCEPLAESMNVILPNSDIITASVLLLLALVDLMTQLLPHILTYLWVEVPETLRNNDQLHQMLKAFVNRWCQIAWQHLLNYLYSPLCSPLPHSYELQLLVEGSMLSSSSSSSSLVLTSVDH